MNITRDIIHDLWPVYAAGEASADTCVLIEQFLRQDPEFAQLIKEEKSGHLASLTAPSLPADHELKTLARTRRQLIGPRWLFLFAVLFSCFAFGRIISDTSWDRSPKPFVATAAIAALLWTAFFVRRTFLRRKALSPRVR